MVPKTRLVGLVSPNFHYQYNDRRRWERGQKPLPIKVGSLQQFLRGYVTANEFFKEHGIPGRPRDLTRQALDEDNKAHRLTRTKPGARLRMIFIAMKRLLLCRYGPGPYGSRERRPVEPALPQHTTADQAYPAAPSMSVPRSGFEWTHDIVMDLRLELEKLVILDVLMRNTDRGLDNFMIYHNPNPKKGERRLRIGAIDNSLAFPHQHPQGIRDYPYGWLFLPTELMEGPFSAETRQLFLPKLSDPLWWAGTIEGLRHIFSQDQHFHEGLFRHQMDLLRGQGWNIVQCLSNGSEGPLELCARPKYVVQSAVTMMAQQQLAMHAVTDLVLGQTTAEHGARSSQETLVPARPYMIQSQRRDYSVSDVRLTSSLPNKPNSPHSPFLRKRQGSSIDVVEHLEAMQKRGASPRSPLMPMDTAQSSVPRDMQPLDLAMPSKSRDYPLPVLVDTLVPVTQRAWLAWD